MKAASQETLVLEELNVPGYERVVKVVDESVGLRAIIAIHNLRLCKAALGGTRIFPYATFDEGLRDVLRLSKGMTYKSAVSESGWGGGKSVIFADSHKGKSEGLLRSFAEAVNRLGGQYICAEDVGCTPDDIATIAQVTPYAVGLPHEKSSGNPSHYTAWGVYRGIQSACMKKFGCSSVEGLTIAIQGVGSVGSRLAELLFWNGASLILSDLDHQKAERLAKLYGGRAVNLEEIFDQPCAVFAPCAMGGVLNTSTIERLKCQIVAGAANNQLHTSEDGERLRERGIFYAPDYVINAGGLINVTEETMQDGYHPLLARNKVDRIYDQLQMIFEMSEQKQIATHVAADYLAEYLLDKQMGKRVEPIYLHHANFQY